MTTASMRSMIVLMVMILQDDGFYDERDVFFKDNNFPDDSVDDKLLFCLGDRDTPLNELLGTFLVEWSQRGENWTTLIGDV